MSGSAGKNNDLDVRLVSAIVMLAVAGTALWLGGWWWVGLVALLVGGVLWEWNGLAHKFAGSPVAEILWLFFGVIYVGAAALSFVTLGDTYTPVFFFMGFIAPVIAVDIGAYFTGRAIGGPKIAPKLSPSKTWAGLFGGAAAAALVALCVQYFYPDIGQFDFGFTPEFDWRDVVGAVLTGIVIAIIAQSGDFFESWMKRRAGVKDSGSLIPGHGGLFDRLDGLIAIFFFLSVTRYAMSAFD